MHIKKNTDIEVLRAIAILTTMFVHLDILLFWGSKTLSSIYGVFFPWGGVDLFFCISGYVITGNLLRSISEAKGAGLFQEVAIPFWIRRVWRILPAAWFWLVVVFFLSIAFNRSGYMGTARGNAIDSLTVILQLANFHSWACFALPGTTCGVDQVYWSLSLEEQSYILLPLLLLFCRRRTAIPVLISIVLIQLFLHRPILSFLWFIRTDALALGALLALYRADAVYSRFEPRFLSRPSVSLLCLSIVCLTAASLTGYFKTIPFHTGLVALSAALLVWVAGFGRGYIFPDGTVKRMLVYIGGRSYALYLIHVPIYRVTREIWLHLAGADTIFDAGFTTRFVATAWILCFVLADLNFRFLENPLRRYGVKLANSRRVYAQSRLTAEIVPVSQ